MKTRYGFVSNSSSSSFIVRYINDPFFDGHSIINLSKQEVKKLEKYGFQKTLHTLVSPIIFHSMDPHDEIWKIKQNKIYSYALIVECNQDDVLLWLLKNNIPFQALCHYGHYHIFYERNSSWVYILPNSGFKIEAYYQRANMFKMFNQIKNSEKPRRIKVSKYIEELKQ